MRHGKGKRARMLLVNASADGEPVLAGCRTTVLSILTTPAIGESLMEHVAGLDENEAITAQHLARALAGQPGRARARDSAVGVVRR